MSIESSRNSNEKSFSPPLNIKNENIICKDGFCQLPNRSESSRIEKRDTNLFDPI